LTIGCFGVASCVVSPLPFISGPAPHLVAAGVVVFLFQNLRVASDATIQANAAPGSCGRVFAVYDVAFNLAYVAGLVGGLAITTTSSVHITLGTVGPLYLVGAVTFALLEREDSQRTKAQLSSDSAPRTDVLAQYTPSDKRERVEYGRNDNESTGGSALPREVP
jgi:predicted MFS family arabinose efflux permease